MVRHDHDFPVSPDGLAELEVDVPVRAGSPTGSRTLTGALIFALRDPLRAAGHDELVAPRCPPVAPGATVRCTVTGVPAAVEVTRPGDGGRHHLHLTVTPQP
ncbi:hypothetical protein AD006_23145 [Pseudonocardia sp. EC080610-09]|uniref:hypothetical protein n=1 Tax=unclassified Pseudonocardia TaxID=2619320 RepID=UPI0006CB2FD1|nr:MULTISPECIES: hypothetical protein [unclassified Pseudonocardia]ALE74073.1 hypothetical protein FRP1_15490 [Pseudonocardia sp. EC080625-04]ALL77484.1 hypothetical protein AD006_23145 [Pseudonocardia sp. EC080610-09]ALL80400.1 hypothetical protein AD017_02735 [Pseudonocardia sp. EC080619-01]